MQQQGRFHCISNSLIFCNKFWQNFIEEIGAIKLEPGVNRNELRQSIIDVNGVVSENGIEVKIGESVTGFIRRTDLSRDRAEQRADRFAVGEKVDAIVTSVDKKTRKLSLSIKARESAEEKQAMAEFGSSDSGASLGDILGAALAKKETDDE